MAKKSIRLHESFVTKCAELELTRQKYEALFNAGQITTVDVYKAYSGLFLELFTEFESLIESLFLGLLTGVLFSRDPQLVRKLRIIPSSSTSDVVFGGKSYVDWLPYDQTLQRSQRFFQNGYPFSVLDNTDKARLSELHKIRNAIAHKSKKANDDFLAIISGLPLLPHEQTPSGYLRSIPNPLVGRSQFEIASSDLDNIARKVCV